MVDIHRLGNALKLVLQVPRSPLEDMIKLTDPPNVHSEDIDNYELLINACIDLCPGRALRRPEVFDALKVFVVGRGQGVRVTIAIVIATYIAVAI